jgi:homoserine/homoserine lactone efflux protein
MTWTSWGLFVATEVVLCLIPGPAVLFVIAQALRYGGRHSLWANTGVLAGNAFYFTLSATGLGALVMTSHTLFSVVKWAGALYLVFLGLQLWRAAGAVARDRVRLAPEAPAAGAALFGRGFILQAANPKALVFFTALLPQFIDVRQPVAPQVLILGVSSVVVEFFVLAGYGLLAGRATHLAREPRFSRMADRVAGTLLIGAGAGLAAASDH